MFGLPEALISFIRRQVGLRNDTASSTGSLHAKITNIADKNIITNGSAVKSVQRGTANLVGTGYTSPATYYEVEVTISSVNLSKAVLIFSNNASPDQTATTNEAVRQSLVMGQIINSTTIQFNRVSAESTSTQDPISWQVIEYY